MARGAVPLAPPGPGLAAAGLVAAAVLGTLAAVFLRAGGSGTLGAADWAAVRFTLVQASLSAALSVGLAVPVARALARRRFAGRAALIALLGAPFILPVIVAVLGLLAVFGRNGLISVLLAQVGLPPMEIYGLHGVVLAHVFFNLPLAARFVLQGWLSVPAEHHRLAASLGLSDRDVARLIERPILRDVLPGAFVAIFAICLTSFAVALTLGGGPRATTVELAIYQAFRFDFDLGRAALLAAVQFGLCAAAALAAWQVRVPRASAPGLDRPVIRWDGRGRGARLADAAWIVAAALFLLTPLATVLIDGAAELGRLPAGTAAAALRSLSVALVAAALATALALALALAVHGLRRRALAALVEAVAMLAIAASPLVLGTGLFLLIRPFADPVAWALAVTAGVNALMALPFAVRALVPEVGLVVADYGRLSASLGLGAGDGLRLVVWPRLRRPLGFAAGLAGALSVGDLGVIALFADPQAPTLPLLMYQLMGAYRMDAAAGVALILVALALATFWAFDRGGRVGTAA